MDIAIIADDAKKELMTQFCIAYCGILSKHHLCATQKTCKYISEATGLEIEQLLGGNEGGAEQIASRVSFNEIDLIFYFRDSDNKIDTESDCTGYNITRLCDIHNIPLATNIATAEVLVMALDRGELNWREIVNPRSDYNMNIKRNQYR